MAEQKAFSTGRKSRRYIVPIRDKHLLQTSMENSSINKGGLGTRENFLFQMNAAKPFMLAVSLVPNGYVAGILNFRMQDLATSSWYLGNLIQTTTPTLTRRPTGVPTLARPTSLHSQVAQRSTQTKTNIRGQLSESWIVLSTG